MPRPCGAPKAAASSGGGRGRRHCRGRRAEDAVVGHELGRVLEACPRVLGGAPGRAACAAAALPDLHRGVEPWEVLVEDLAVEVLLLRLGSVLREGLRGLRPLLVRDGALAHLLQLLHPGLAHALALHGLGAPQHLVWHLAPEEPPQHGLLRPVFLDLLHRRVDGHGSLDDVGAQEGHACLHAVGHGHAVRALAVDVVEVPEDAPQLTEEGLAGRSVVEVEVPCGELVRALACEHRLAAVRVHQPGKEEVGDGRSHELWLVGLQVVDDVLNARKGLLRGEEVLVMHSAQVLGDQPRGGDIRAVRLPNGVGVKSLAALPHHGRHELAYHGRVHTPTEEEADAHVAHELLPHGRLQRLLEDLRIPSLRYVSGLVPLRLVPPHQAFLLGPIVARWELLGLITDPDE
mmetsp:Transcript_76258/g.184471  ORF Transcript_76258/g.184471 Transcript_76258/m.184471 type:complete len:403 (+) Transcript_76258:249-1457(+)